MTNLTKVTLTNGVPGGNGDVSTIDALMAMVATQQGLLDVIAAIEAQSTGGDATAANQSTMITALQTLHTDLATTLAPYLDGLEGLIGTSNSALASILTALTSTIAGYVDGLETLVTGSNTKLDTIHTDLGTTLSGLLTDLKGYVDGLESLTTSSNTKLDTIHTDLGTTLAALLTSLNGYVDQLEGYTDGLESLVTSSNTKLDSIHTDLATTLAGYVDGLETLLGKLVFGAGNQSLAQRVTIATDSPGVTTLGQTTKAASLPTARALDEEPAHDAVDAGIGTKMALKATTSLAAKTLVASDDRTDAFAGVDGVQITRPHCNLEDVVTGNATNTDGTATPCIAAQAAGIKTYLTSIILCNTSAVAITVDIKDGSTVKLSLPLPAGSGCIFNPPVPIPGSIATAWNFDGSAAASTVTCSMVGFKSKV